jgi:hypothetical protein
MAKQKLRYLGNGPGQGASAAIGGVRYEPYQTYNIDDELADILLRKGGFEVVKPAVRKAEKATEELDNDAS